MTDRMTAAAPPPCELPYWQPTAVQQRTRGTYLHAYIPTAQRRPDHERLLVLLVLKPCIISASSLHRMSSLLCDELRRVIRPRRQIRAASSLLPPLLLQRPASVRAAPSSHNSRKLHGASDAAWKGREGKGREGADHAPRTVFVCCSTVAAG